MSIEKIKKIVDYLDEKAEAVEVFLNEKEKRDLKNDLKSSYYKVYQFKKVVDFKDFKELKKSLDLSWREGCCLSQLHVIKGEACYSGYLPKKSELKKDDLKNWFIVIDSNFNENLKKYDERKKIGVVAVHGLPYRDEYLNFKTSYKATRQRELNRFYKLKFLLKRRKKFFELDQAFNKKEDKRLVDYDFYFNKENQARFLRAKAVIDDSVLISNEDKLILSECRDYLDFKNKAFLMRSINRSMLERAAGEKFTEYKFTREHFNKDYDLWCGVR